MLHGCLSSLSEDKDHVTWTVHVHIRATTKYGSESRVRRPRILFSTQKQRSLHYTHTTKLMARYASVSRFTRGISRPFLASNAATGFTYILPVTRQTQDL